MVEAYQRFPVRRIELSSGAGSGSPRRSVPGTGRWRASPTRPSAGICYPSFRSTAERSTTERVSGIQEPHNRRKIHGQPRAQTFTSALWVAVSDAAACNQPAPIFASIVPTDGPRRQTGVAIVRAWRCTAWPRLARQCCSLSEENALADADGASRIGRAVGAWPGATRSAARRQEQKSLTDARQASLDTTALERLQRSWFARDGAAASTRQGSRRRRQSAPLLRREPADHIAPS